MPMSCSMCTTSSVATLPVAPGAYGQPPSPPTLASNSVTPSSSAVRMLASAGAPGVVEVQQDRHVRLPLADRRHQLADPARAWPCRWCRRTRPGRRRRRPPGRRSPATRAGSMSPSYGQPKLVATITSAVAPASCSSVDQRGDVVQRLGGGAVDVARGCGCRWPRPPPRSRRTRRRAPAARRGCWAPGRSTGRPGTSRRRGPHLVGVGHLRDRLRVHERDRLDPPHAGAGQRVEQRAPSRRSGPGPRSAARRAAPTSRIETAGSSVHLIRPRRCRCRSRRRRTRRSPAARRRTAGCSSGPTISKPATAARARAIASARSAPCTISLAISES